MSTKFSSKLAGRRVVVIGGSSGIGYAVAEGALEFGAIVTIASSNTSKLASAVQTLSSSYPDAIPRITGHICDLGEPDNIEQNLAALFDFASSGGQRRLDHVVNTAGAIRNTVALKDASYENLRFDRYVAAVMIGKLSGRYMTYSAAASVTFTSGTSISKPHKGYTTLAPNVGAVEPLCRALAVELAPLRFNAVSPGPTETELLAGTTGGDVDEMRKYWSDTTLLGVGKVEDIAEGYLFAMRNNFVTGTVINCDGGAILR